MKNILLVTAAALLCVAYVGSAAWSVREIAEGVRLHDAERISRQVDYPAVRASLQEQLTAAIAAAARRDSRAGADRRANGFDAAPGGAGAAAMIDSMVTPAGLAALLGSRKNARTQFAPGEVFERLRILGPGEIGFVEPNGAALRLAFRGGGWKVVSLTLPSETLREFVETR